MRNRFWSPVTAVTMAAMALSLAAVPAAGQAAATSAKNWTPPRTVDGQPNFQGYWRQLGDLTTYSLQAGESDRAEHIRVSGQSPNKGRAIVDPPDGKIPYQPWAAAKAAMLHEQHRKPSKVEYLDPTSRGFLEGVPRINIMGSFRVIQTPGMVVILHEYGHHYRVIPLDKRPHIGENIKLWMGDSRGRWEGNTLVVDVTNHNEHTWFDIVGSFHSDQLHVVERWTLVGADRLEYEVTIEDPKVFARPWKMRWPVGRLEDEEQWESATWEGNRTTEHVMGEGAR